MVFYFSATGNSKYVATKLATKLNDTLLDIEQCINENKFVFDGNGKNAIFVMPVYFWDIPEIVKVFIKKSIISNISDVFAVVTYGDAPGCITSNLKKNLSIKCLYSIKMPETFTPMYKIPSEESIKDMFKNVDEEIIKIVRNINEKKECKIHRDTFTSLLSPFLKILYAQYNKTKTFTVGDNCISCGICEKNCPCNAIKMLDGKPTWSKKSCMLCLRCLHNCPEFAIQHGNKTRKNGQYKIEQC